MQCIDSADFPTVVIYEKDTFEDDLLHIKGNTEGELVVCGYHPKVPIPVSLESQELDWQRCNQICEIILIVAIAIVVFMHLQFITNFLQAKIKRAYYKQTHLHVKKEKEHLGSKLESDLTVTSTPFPTTITAKTSTLKSKVLNMQLPKGMTQEDYIDFERYEQFIYAQAHEL